MAPTASGSSQLILTVTRACNLRCSYCPTAKEGWPSLTVEQARAAVALFDERYGGGTIKLFGGEPLLVPDVVRAVLDEGRHRPRVRWIQLSTNGLGLDRAWLQRLGSHPKAILTLSLDGGPRAHRRHRRALPGVADAYDHVLSLLPQLLRTPRVGVTQVIAPATAAAAAENLAHLRSLGFYRFNLLPGYYLPWRPEQLEALEVGLARIELQLRAAWASGERLHLRNLFTRAPTPFFNTGVVVDADGSIHPSNVGLSGQLDGLRGRTQVGTLDDPPTQATLQRHASRINAMLAEVLPERIWASTQAVDRLLTELCRRLYRPWLAARRARLSGIA